MQLIIYLIMIYSLDYIVIGCVMIS